MRAEELTEPESALWEAFPTARTVDLGGQGEVRAEVIAALLLGARPPEPGRVPAVRLTGAKIIGRLDLSFADVPYAALLRDCEFAETPSLYGARLRQVNLTGSRLPGLQASDAHIDGLLWLKDCRFDGPVTLVGTEVNGALSLGSARIDGAGPLRADDLMVSRDLVADHMRASGEVLLRGVRVQGTVILDGARLSYPNGVALNLDRARVDGAVQLGDGLHAEGMVSLRSAVIGGMLDLNGAELVNPSGIALRGHLVTVGSSLRASKGFHAQGLIYLDAARVNGSIVLDGAHLSNQGGIALAASRAEITGGLFGKYGFVADGAIHLVDTRVGASVDFSGARLTAPGTRALKAHGINVVGVVDCCDGFTAEGRVSFAGARIGGDLCFDDATISAPGEAAISCRQVRAATLRLRTRGVDGAVDVRHARVEVLRDAPKGWPPGSRLEGFTYETVEDPGAGADRLGWLDGADGYQPQPYEQLAGVYRRLGQDADARTVQLARQRRRRRTLPRWLAVWGLVQDWTVGYGYRPQRALLWLAGLLAVGVVAFGAHHPPPLKAGEAPPFNPLLYTLDLLLPVIGFGQEDAFGPRGWQQWLAAALVASGWILATTIAAGVSRVLSR
ncbi:oxidoreductase [Actinoallomurus acanthiterrae]